MHTPNPPATAAGVAAPPQPPDVTQAANLHWHDVVQIGPHQAQGVPVRCPKATVEIEDLHWADATHRAVVLDYIPWAESFPFGPPRQRGSVVYDRTTPVRVVVHADEPADVLLAISQVATQLIGGQ